MAKAKNSKLKNTHSTEVEKKTTKTVAVKRVQKEQIESSTYELRRLSTILISIVGVISIFYIITVIVTRKSGLLHYQISDEISQISYTEILASDILRKDGIYYVLVKDNSDVYISLYETYISSYTSSEEHMQVYSVDLNDALNQNYRAEQNNLSPEKLQFKGTTLLKISNNVIEASYEDSTSINEHLKSLVVD